MSYRYLNAAYGHNHIGNYLTFSALTAMDSLFGSTMCKRALVLKLGEKNSSSSYFLNGKYVRKKNFVLYRSRRAIQKDGDFCIGVSVVLLQSNGLLICFNAKQRTTSNFFSIFIFSSSGAERALVFFCSTSNFLFFIFSATPEKQKKNE